MFCPVPLISISVSVPVPYCFDCYSFVVWSEVGVLDSSSSVFLSHNCFGSLGSFVSPYKLKKNCSSFVKNAFGNLVEIALNLYIALSISVILTVFFFICEI